jgi:hypothetical protein
VLPPLLARVTRSDDGVLLRLVELPDGRVTAAVWDGSAWVPGSPVAAWADHSNVVVSDDELRELGVPLGPPAEGDSRG